MPPIQGILLESDRVTITTHRGTFVLSRADIPAPILNQPVATIEAHVNGLLATYGSPFGLKCLIHVYQVTPTLEWTAWCGDTSAPDPTEPWWP